MNVEQRVTHVFAFEHVRSDVHIEMLVRVATPGDPGVQVTSHLAFDALLDDQLQDIFNQFLFDAIHGGLATHNPLPDHGIAVEVAALTITPKSALEHKGKLIGEVVRITAELLSKSVAVLLYTLVTLDASNHATKKSSHKRKIT
jgi:hypothetical protein